MEYKWKTPMCHFFVLFFICLIGNAGATPVCSQEEYRVGERCCYACDPGWQVHKDCTGRTQTYCHPCAKGTFQEGFNGNKRCTSCTSCDAERGLRLKEPCTDISDALCGLLDGYFCIDPRRDGCREAQRHRVSCGPGHHISQTGTADKDTECLKCSYGTFSNGTSTSCQPHTKCESLELDQIKAGTDSTDSECGKAGSNKRTLKRLIIPILVVVAAVALVTGILIMGYHQEQMRSNPRTAGSGSSVFIGELNEDKKPEEEDKKHGNVANRSCRIRFWNRRS